MAEWAVPYRQPGLPQARWSTAVLLALLIHLVPLVAFTLPPPPDPDAAVLNEASMQVEFTSLPSSEQTPMSLPLPAPSAQAPAAPAIPPPSAPKVIQPQPKADANPLKPPERASPPEPEKRVAMLELPPMTAPTVAFDESKTTRETPKEGYLSDRTSTAADRGPKDLPRGDPYMDKGQSRIVRTQEKSGEGNLPAFASDPRSGSVRKDGSPDAGSGPQHDPRKPDRERPPEAAAQQAPQEQKGAAPQDATRPGGQADAPARAPRPRQDNALKPELLAEKPEQVKRPREPGALPDGIKPDSFVQAGPQPGKSEDSKPPDVRGADGKPSEAEQKAPERSAGAAIAQKPDPKRELEAFEALLDVSRGREGRGGMAGEKTGIHARPGEKGHEGDGTARPGHAEAVSDLTTLNIISSAAEFDEARFGKIKDPKSAYFKPLFRRVHDKWKAEIAARARDRKIRGIVGIKIVVRKDGTLLEASEISRQPKDMPAEYVAIVKLAIELAAKPKSEPFPADLLDNESLDIGVFFYY